MNKVVNETGRHRQEHRRAFSLVEVLIVVGIIGILLAIAVPSYRKARTDSQRKKAQGELQLLATAIRQLMWDTHFVPNGYEIGSSQGDNLEVANLTLASAGILRATSAYVNWKGPYLRKLGKDPWGQNYFFDPDYQVGSVNRVVVGSYGPNRVGLNLYDSDDIIVVLK